MKLLLSCCKKVCVRMMLRRLNSYRYSLRTLHGVRVSVHIDDSGGGGLKMERRMRLRVLSYEQARIGASRMIVVIIYCLFLSREYFVFFLWASPPYKLCFFLREMYILFIGSFEFVCLKQRRRNNAWISSFLHFLREREKEKRAEWGEEKAFRDDHFFFLSN